jgi:hypothetical protein
MANLENLEDRALNTFREFPGVCQRIVASLMASMRLDARQ